MPARPRSLRARTAALVVGAVVVLGACTHQQPTPDSYGDTTSRNFNEGCVAALTSDSDEGEALSDDIAENTCECIYDGIVDGQDGVDAVPFDEFKEINSELSDDPGPLPEAIADHVRACEAREVALR